MTPPLVSVVVPSLNQERFLASALDSILGQDHPRIEVLVMDGGSTDGSVALLDRYADRISFVSAPDGGQSAAINRGFARASGEIVAWLNADDRYLPGAVRRGVAALAEHPDAGMVYGGGEVIDERGETLGPFDAHRPFDLWNLIHVTDYVLQPATFLRAASVQEVGGVDESLHYAMDWDLWIRMAYRWPVACVRETLAQTREHAAAKTARGGFERLRELRMILRRHGAAAWSPAAIAYGLDTLRKRFPAVLGPGSRAQERAQRGRLLPSLLRPVHHLLARVIDHQLRHRQGVYAGGWVARRAHLAVPWRGAAGVARVRGELPAEALARPCVLELCAAGARAVLVRDRSGPFEVAVAVPSSPGPPRALELRLRASCACRRAGFARPLAFRLLDVRFVEHAAIAPPGGDAISDGGLLAAGEPGAHRPDAHHGARK